MAAWRILRFARQRRLRDEERPGDLRRGQASQGAQRQRHLGLDGQRGVTAGEDQPQPLIPDTTVVTRRLVCRRQHRDLLQLGGPGRSAAQLVERTVTRRRGEPRAGVAGNAVAGPGLQRPRDGVLRALLGEVPVTRGRDEGRDDPAPFLAKRTGDRGLDRGGYSSQIGLTSIVPTRAPGIFPAISMASSRSLQSTR